MKLLITFITFISISTLLNAVIPTIAKSVSPDGKIYAVMDIDRDPKISPAWKGDSYPKIEITEKISGKVLVSLVYFGAVADDKRPLREHITICWRPDSKAFAVTINDRFYSSSSIYTLNKNNEFVHVPLPTNYEKMTGFTQPNVKHLRPRGGSKVVGWDKDGLLIYSIFLSPLPSFVGTDPLQHRIFLQVTPTKMKPMKVEHEKGKWRNGDWIKDNTKQDAQSPDK